MSLTIQASNIKPHNLKHKKETTALSHRLKKENKIDHDLYGITFDRPTYILPYYHTGSPFQDIGSTPDNQRIMSNEFKMQLSFKFPIWRHILHSNWSMGGSYTQLNYWQVYAQSQFFRETNYAPALFLTYQISPKWNGTIGAIHQSNGRGGEYERSWNRTYFDFQYSGSNWLVSVKPWILIFTNVSSNIHNPKIAKYLGYERILLATKFHKQEISLMARNTVESKFKYMALEADYSFPIHGLLHGYVQLFHGYGQSLIEYRHKTTSFGLGISLSNWI